MTPLEFFAFDVLGDFVAPSSIKVLEDGSAVEVRIPVGCPLGVAEMMEADWKREAPKAGFGDVELTVIRA